MMTSNAIAEEEEEEVDDDDDDDDDTPLADIRAAAEAEVGTTAEAPLCCRRGTHTSSLRWC